MSDKGEALTIIDDLEVTADVLREVNERLEALKEHCYGWKVADAQIHAQQAEQSVKIAMAKTYDLVKSLTEDEADAIKAEPIKKEPF